MKKFLLLIALLLCSNVALGQFPEPASSHIWERAAYGDKPGFTQVIIDGYNPSPNTTYEILGTESNAAFSFPTAALTTPYCASTDNTNDKANGTGCLTISVSGVNTSFTAFTETVTMTGTTSANLATANVAFLNSITCTSAGSTGSNTGTIRCGTGINTAGVPAVVLTHMTIGSNRSQQFTYAVPAGYTALCREPQIANYNAGNVGVDVEIDTKVGLTGLVMKDKYSTSSHGGNSPGGEKGFVTKYPATTMIIGNGFLSTAGSNPLKVKMPCILLNNSWVSTAQGVF